MSGISSFSDYSSKYNYNQDYSSLFPSTSSGSSSGYGFSLTDYMHIQNGSYGKLMKSYYAKKDAEKTAGSEDDVKKTKLLDSSAKSLKEAANALMDKKLWEKKTITKKDEETGEETKVEDYDWDAITKAVKDFTDAYNKVLEDAGDSNNKGILRNAAWMVQMAEKNSKLLSKVGIKIGEGNKLSVDEEKLKAADMSTLKSVFTGSLSFADKVAQRSAGISRAAAGVTTYTSNGTHSDILSELVSGKVDEEV